MTNYLFFSGKGGVGKTTISCVVAVQIARKGFKTRIVTTDPAAHLGEVFGVKVGSSPVRIAENLFTVMIDQDQAFAEYKERTLSEARGKYSEDMVAAMQVELNSPCTEFIRFIEGREYDVIVFDSAPSGHTHRLLDLPFDYAKQVAMITTTDESAGVKQETQNRFREIISLLRDKDRAVSSFVLYSESTPIMKSYRAMRPEAYGDRDTACGAESDIARGGVCK